MTTEQKKDIEKGEIYSAYDEMLAIAVLKRGLDLAQGQYKQRHEDSMVSIETERAGRGFKIKWTFGPHAPAAYELVGFRKTGAFYPDQWDEVNNGSLVMQSPKSGETTEFLKEGETYFYTFILKPWDSDKKKQRYGIARFQITIVARDETDAIEQTIRRVEEKKTRDQPSPHVARALKELGSYVEFDTAIEKTAQQLIQGIKDSGYSAEQKQDKIERLNDLVNDIRANYDQ